MTMRHDATQITQLLHQAQQGNTHANEQLMSLLYQDLKTIAARQRLKFNQPTINTTGIVHEAWLKLNKHTADIKDRQHFMATASLAIRHLLINEIKKKQSLKHQQPDSHTYSSELHGETDVTDWMLQLDQAIDRMNQNHPRLSQVFQLHYFAGLSYQDIAETFEITSKTVQRDWIKAKMLLATYLC